jgi:argininosuccinate lyase
VSADPHQPEVWRARIAGELHPTAQKLNDSLPFDARLWPEELVLSRAYATALVECGVMSAAEAKALDEACDALASDLESGVLKLAGEDVHSAVEADLARRCGEPARRLHTGRSRNDQVATLLRMRVMGLCDEAVEDLRALERALVGQARAAGDRAVAAYTHLQPAQPVLLAHVWLAHVEAIERDEERFLAAREAADRMPLGSGAVAGTPLRYDRVALAARLGFSRLAANSLDAVGDRDFAVEYLNAAALLGVHLSRLAEDLVLWCSPGFGWFTPPDGFATGSSLLPQKRNPDLFELTRGKCGRLLANAQRLAVVLKGLPSAYQKDLQEDKEAVFDTADTLETVLAALPLAIAALAPRPERMTASLTPDLLAVELADALVAEGMPFRDAHAAVGRLWAEAERRGVTPAALPLADRLAILPQFGDERLAALSVEAALARRSHAPGAGPESVAQQLRRVEARLGLGVGDEEEAGEGRDARASEGTDRKSGHAVQASAAGGAGDPGARSDALGARGRQDAVARPEERGGAMDGGAERAARSAPGPPAAPPDQAPPAAALDQAPEIRPDGITLRRATLADVSGIAGIMAGYVAQGLLLPRPVSELFQCVREFHVAERPATGSTPPEIVACAALRVLWSDLGEVRSLAVREDMHGRGLGRALVTRVLDDARALALPRVIALTRDVPFFERCGFAVHSRESLPRKVWTDCVRCPRRHACDEVAVVLDLVPGASEAASRAGRSFSLPIPQRARVEPLLPIVS